MGSALDDEWGDTATAAFAATVINSEALGADRSTLTCPCKTGSLALSQTCFPIQSQLRTYRGSGNMETVFHSDTIHS